MTRARLLLITESGDITQEFEIDKANVVIGRAPQSNIVISSSDVSRVHAQIVSTAHGFFISDMGSTNGTFLNGSQIQPKQMFQLKSNDQVNLGVVSLLFQLVSDSIPTPNPSYAPVEDYAASQARIAEQIHSELPVESIFPDQHPYSTTKEDFHFNQPLQNPVIANTPPYEMSLPEPKASLTEEELLLAKEIFEEEKNAKKKEAGGGGINWASWNKANIFKKPSPTAAPNKANPIASKNAAVDLSEDELFKQVFGSETNLPSSDNLPNQDNTFTNLDSVFQSQKRQSKYLNLTNQAIAQAQAARQKAETATSTMELVKPSAPKIINELPLQQLYKQSANGNFPEVIPYEREIEFSTKITVKAPSQQIQTIYNQIEKTFKSQKYTVDTESYYYPQASSEGNSQEAPKDYYIEDEQDPFAALKFKDEDSAISKFLNLGTSFFNKKPSKKNAKPRNPIKFVALPVALAITITLGAIYLIFRNTSIFG